jgi:hypothetical protein
MIEFTEKELRYLVIQSWKTTRTSGLQIANIKF